jgi:endoglucanase
MIGVSPILSQKHTDGLITEAKTRKIPYQLEIMGGGTGTDSDRITFTDGGVETALVSVPMRNMHTAAETVFVSDIDKSAKLIAAYVNTLGGAAHV